MRLDPNRLDRHLPLQQLLQQLKIVSASFVVIGDVLFDVIDIQDPERIGIGRRRRRMERYVDVFPAPVDRSISRDTNPSGRLLHGTTGSLDNVPGIDFSLEVRS